MSASSITVNTFDTPISFISPPPFGPFLSKLEAPNISVNHVLHVILYSNNISLISLYLKFKGGDHQGVEEALTEIVTKNLGVGCLIIGGLDANI
jgi:hypothetical protein